MTCEDYKTWSLNYVPQKWRGLAIAMNQGYILLDLRSEPLFPEQVQSSRHTLNALIKPYKRPRIHDGYVIFL